MDKRTPFFLTNLLKIREKSESSEENGWGDTTSDTKFNGWDSSVGSTDSGPITNGWADEPESRYNGWASGALTKPRFLETNTNGWAYEKPNDEYNGWGSGSGSSGKCLTPEASSNGWMMNETVKDEYDGWGSGSGSSGKCLTPEASSNGWMMNETVKDECNGWSSIPKSTTSKVSSNQRVNEQPEYEPVSKKVDIDVELRPLVIESWAPSAPPLPHDSFSENAMIANVSGKDLVATSESKNGTALCVVCWEGRVEGACVPCGHMASCMSCLHEIESKQRTCPVCRAKIDKVMRIYAISTQ